MCRIAIRRRFGGHRTAAIRCTLPSGVFVLLAEPLFATAKPLSVLPVSARKVTRRATGVAPGSTVALPVTCMPSTQAAPVTSSLPAALANKLAGANPLQPRSIRDREI